MLSRIGMLSPIELRIELVDPQTAERYLNANRINRALRPSIVERYASDMRAGHWTECTAAIAFDAEGNLLDGQHRLRAVVESGASQQFIVVRGLPREAMLNMDTGVTRRRARRGGP